MMSPEKYTQIYHQEYFYARLLTLSGTRYLKDIKPKKPKRTTLSLWPQGPSIATIYRETPNGTEAHTQTHHGIKP